MSYTQVMTGSQAMIGAQVMMGTPVMSLGAQMMVPSVYSRTVGGLWVRPASLGMGSAMLSAPVGGQMTAAATTGSVFAPVAGMTGVSTPSVTDAYTPDPNAAPDPAGVPNSAGAHGAAVVRGSAVAPETMPTDTDIDSYKSALICKGKADATINKYLRGIFKFLAWLGDRLPSAELIRLWMTERQESGTAVSSVNGMLSALNGFWKFLGRHDCVLPLLKMERSQYVPEERRLTEDDFQKLLNAAKDQPQALALLQTIAATGVRVSELRFFTVESVKEGVVRVTNKGKTREVLLHKETRKLVLDYCKMAGIRSGVIFTNKKGAALSRGYIWYVLKRLCKKAGVAESKVFPHNLRRLFAVRVYRQTRDIDFVRRRLGHRSAVTTSLYIRGSLDEDRKRLDELRLVG